MVGLGGYATSLLAIAAQAPPGAQMAVDHWALLALIFGGALALWGGARAAWAAWRDLLTTIDERVASGVKKALDTHIAREEMELTAIKDQITLVLQHLKGTVPVTPSWDRISDPAHKAK
jgi:hypothetical protein